MTKENMTQSDIEAWINRICADMTEKGVEMPDACVKFDQGSTTVYLAKKYEYTFASYWRGGVGSTIAEKMADLDAFVAALPSPEESHRAEFLRKLADAADYGNAHNIDAAFINPITEAMKALSENALEDKR